MSDSSPVLSTRNLTKFYGESEKAAVADLNLSISSGEVLGFVGPNGAGKSTTMKMLLGLILPTSGSGSIFGMDMVADSVAIRNRSGYLSGEVKLYDHMTGKQLLEFSDHMRGGGNEERISELCSMFELPLQRKIKTYSAGQKQQLAIILALFHPSDLLVLDEPTKALDPSRKRDFIDLIKDRSEQGTTVLISSHVLGEIEPVCHRVAFIREGVLLAQEHVEAVRQQMSSVIIATFENSVTEQELLKLPGVSSARTRRNEWILGIQHDRGCDVIRQLADMPLTGLRYNDASLDDLYEAIYIEAGEKR